VIRSMTGYGRAKQGSLTVEIRAVNHRYLDVNVRVPRALSFLEEPMGKLAARTVKRGKVEVCLVADNLSAETTRMQLNREVLEGYLETARLLEQEYGLAPDLTVSSAMRLPDVLVAARQEPDVEAMTAQVLGIAETALSELIAARELEGAHMTRDILEKLQGIEELTGRIERRMPESVAAYREKLTGRMREVLEQQPDESRILQEAALYADRVAVDEETVRLRGHIAALRGMLESRDAVGRKMDFLIQEFGREANTIGSKCSDAETQSLVIDLKSEIEKLREQAQNIE